MSKETKKQELEQQSEVLPKKKLIPEIGISEEQFADPDFHKKGNYLLEHLPTGTLMSVTQRTYDRVFSKDDAYIVKKSTNQ